MVSSMHDHRHLAAGVGDGLLQPVVRISSLRPLHLHMHAGMRRDDVR